MGCSKSSFAPGPRGLRTCATAGARADFASLAGLAHKVKGTAGDLVATGLQARAREAEHAARSADPGAIGLNLDLADQLEELLEEIRTAVAGAG